MNRFACLFSLLCFASMAHGQGPDFRGEYRTEAPEIPGQPVSAPVPREMHTWNANPRMPGWGGCVPSSVRTAALYHGVPRAQVDAFWKLAQERIGRGGTDPETLRQMLAETMPDVKYYSTLTRDTSTLDALSRKGVAICSTMGWGQGYPGMIDHWVNVIEFRNGRKAMFIDNNDPGFYHIVPAEESARRSTKDGREVAWYFCFTQFYGIRGFWAQYGLTSIAVIGAAAVGVLLATVRPQEGRSCSA